ncbi:MAG: YhfC family intramembrane metalloprotease [Nanoarchaeota archaeon]|nr:YhfC family intramembrane metalloprotease [Nanoarchaeota archaeon]
MSDFLTAAFVGCVIAIGPFLALSFWVNRGNRGLWKAFFFGWGGWLAALLVRLIPVQLPVILAPGILESMVFLIIYGAYASAMAGLFEEGFRYTIMKRKISADQKTLLTFGLGWGVGEALLLYVPNILALPLVLEIAPSLLDILPGAIERNLAIVLHLALTMIVFSSFSKGRKYLWLAMFLHFLVNMAAVSAVTVTQNIWLTELLVAVLVALSFLIARWATKTSPLATGFFPARSGRNL